MLQGWRTAARVSAAVRLKIHAHVRLRALLMNARAHDGRLRELGSVSKRFDAASSDSRPLTRPRDAPRPLSCSATARQSDGPRPGRVQGNLYVNRLLSRRARYRL